MAPRESLNGGTLKLLSEISQTRPPKSTRLSALSSMRPQNGSLGFEHSVKFAAQISEVLARAFLKHTVTSVMNRHTPQSCHHSVLFGCGETWPEQRWEERVYLT